MKTSFRFLGALLGVAVVLMIVIALFIYSGAYNISATSGHTKFVGGALNEMMERSVRSHAQGIVPPAGLDLRDPARLEKGAGHFEAMCSTCHGAPGKKADPWQLYPPAPDLADAVRDQPWSDAEVFWIIKNGIKDTGMSAFGGSHGDDDIWGMVALIRQFPSMKPEQYHELAEKARASEEREGGGHSSESSAEKNQTHKKSEPPHTH